MGQNFKETAHLKTDYEKYSQNYEHIFGNKEEKMDKHLEDLTPNDVLVYIKKLEARLLEANKVIGFYSRQENWMGYHRHVDTINRSDITPDKAIEDGFDIQVGGKRAREYMKKFED